MTGEGDLDEWAANLSHWSRAKNRGLYLDYFPESGGFVQGGIFLQLHKVLEFGDELEKRLRSEITNLAT